MGKTLNDVKAGDTVFYVHAYNRSRGSDETVSKVTRTHIHLTNGTRYLKADGEQTGTEYTPGKIYANRQDYEDVVRLTTKWNTFYRSLPHSIPSDLTEAELDELLHRFGLDKTA